MYSKFLNGAGCGSPSQDLLRATKGGDMQAVQSLLRCPGVDVNVQDAANYGYTPLIKAARIGDRQMVQVRKTVWKLVALINKPTQSYTNQIEGLKCAQDDILRIQDNFLKQILNPLLVC